MNEAERSRFYLGLGVLVAMVALMLAIVWAVVMWITAGALAANGGWLVCIIIFACAVGLLLRSVAIDNRAALRRVREERRLLESVRTGAVDVGGGDDAGR